MKKRKNKIVPHDALIRRLLQEPGYPLELFDTLLPEDLKSELVWDTLQFSKDSFVDEDLSKHFSDAIFDVSLRNRNKNIPIQISLLIEHKSSPDRYISVQVMRYMGQALQHQVNNVPTGKKFHKLKAVIPLVIYHGGSRWKARPLRALFDEELKAIEAYLPHIPFVFQNINLLSVETILSIDHTLAKASLLVQMHSHDPEGLFSYLKLISQILDEGNPNKALFVYIFKILDTTYTKEAIISQIDPPMEMQVRSFYDKLIAEGFEQGIEKGIEKGLLAEKTNTIHRMAAQSFSPEQIAAGVGMGVEEVNEILKQG